MKRTGIILILLVVAVSFLNAQNVLSLTPDRAVECALKGNLSFRNEEIGLRQAERGYKNSWNAFLPSITAAGGLMYSNRLFTNGTTATGGPWNLDFSLNVSLPLNWSASPGLESARLQYEAGKISYHRAKAGIRRDVLKNYYSLVLQEANLDVLKENADLADALLMAVRIRYEKGLTPETDLLEARVNAGQLRNNYLNSQASYENNLAGFLTLSGLASDIKVQLTGVLEKPAVAVDTDKALSLVLQSADLQMLLLNISLKEKSKEAAAAEYLTPTLSLGAGWEDSAAEPFVSADWRDNLSLSIAVSVSLDGVVPGSRASTAIDALYDGIETARNDYQLAFDKKRTTVRGLLLSIENAERSSTVSLENRTVAQKSLDLTREAWRIGTRSLLEVQTNQTNLLSASQDYLLSLYSWISSLLDLEYELGIELGDTSPGTETNH